MTPRQGERLFKPKYSKILLSIAEEDLISAEALFSTKRGRLENVAFFCQQAIEKTLKAVLCAKSIPISLVHDLGVLVAKMPGDLFPPYGYELMQFNDYAEILRYETGNQSLTDDDINAAINVAKEVIEWAKPICG